MLWGKNYFGETGGFRVVEVVHAVPNGFKDTEEKRGKEMKFGSLRMLTKQTA
jgi:hypothetical protein